MADQRQLSIYDHDRDSAGFTYVYPVVSRRAGGVSLGINLNPNNACNWRCLYCQVPDLSRGAAPPIDEERLGGELNQMLDQLCDGDYLERQVADPALRRLVDVAFSGNGEPTTSAQFEAIVARVLGTLDERGLSGELNKVLISNGSMLQRAGVQRGIERLGKAGGEVWFKLDSATPERRLELNGTPLPLDRVRTQLRQCARLCRTRIQTCAVQLDGSPPSEAEQEAYLAFLSEELRKGTAIADVLLYGIARAPQQPGADRLSAVSSDWLAGFAERIRSHGLGVVVRS